MTHTHGLLHARRFEQTREVVDVVGDRARVFGVARMGGPSEPAQVGDEEVIVVLSGAWAE
jgi:hypothetical protein